MHFPARRDTIASTPPGGSSCSPLLLAFALGARPHGQARPSRGRPAAAPPPKPLPLAPWKWPAVPTPTYSSCRRHPRWPTLATPPAKMWRCPARRPRPSTVYSDLTDRAAAIKAIQSADLIWMPGGDQNRLLDADESRRDRRHPRPLPPGRDRRRHQRRGGRAVATRAYLARPTWTACKHRATVVREGWACGRA